MWATEAKICNFLSDPLSSHSSSNSLHILPLIISSEVSQTQLVEKDRSRAICSALFYWSACKRVCFWCMRHLPALKNGRPCSGEIGEEASDWRKRGESKGEEEWSGGRWGPLKIPESTWLCVNKWCIRRVGCDSKTPRHHRKRLAQHLKLMTRLIIPKK